MNVLVFNTTTMNADIILLCAGKRYHKRMNTLTKHSESLLRDIDMLLQEAKIKPCNIDVISVCVGPGSFTGIRLSLAVAKGFMLANPNMKAISINTFELMQKSYKSEENLVFVMNALSGKYYVKTSDNDACLSSDISNLKQKIIGLMEEGLPFADDYVEIDPFIMLDLVLEKISNGEILDDLNPLYLRKSQAEENLDADN